MPFLVLGSWFFDIDFIAPNPAHKKAKQGLEPKFRNRFGALTQRESNLQKRSRALSPMTATGLAG